jgi:spore coat protein U-like protein
VIGRLLAAGLFVIAFSTRGEAACTVSSSSVVFGSYNVFATSDTTSTGTVTYQCGNKDHDIQISLSTGSSGSYSNRTLTRSSEPLNYNLYIDAAFATIWGDGTGGTDTYTNHNPPNGTDVNLTIYGRILAQQDVSVGSYADTIVVTVNF